MQSHPLALEQVQGLETGQKQAREDQTSATKGQDQPQGRKVFEMSWSEQPQYSREEATISGQDTPCRTFGLPSSNAFISPQSSPDGPSGPAKNPGTPRQQALCQTLRHLLLAQQNQHHQYQHPLRRRRCYGRAQTVEANNPTTMQYCAQPHGAQILPEASQSNDG